MAIDIQPGQWINVKVTKAPRSEGGFKTMQKLFEKDADVKEERKRINKSRPQRWHIRGGRPWQDRPRRHQIVNTEPGATYKLFGAVDVMRELGSIEEYVEVTPA